MAKSKTTKKSVKKPEILKVLGTTKTATLSDDGIALLIKEKTRIPINTIRRVLKSLRQIGNKYSSKGGKK